MSPGSAPERGSSRRQQGASVQAPDLKSRSRSYLNHHARVARESLLRLWSTPLATLMTLAVIAIALTLPAVLQAGLQNLQGLTRDWQGMTQMSIFLRPEVSDAAAEDLARQLAANEQIAKVHYLSPQAALQEFQSLSGFSEALQLLEENPLPGVLLVEPAPGYQDSTHLEALRRLLASVEGVDSADLDLGWVQRLQAILRLLNRGLVAISLLLGMTVLLVVGNTLRLAIENRRHEVVVAKLVGATDAFVRRPFLYTGAWFGIGGGLLALLLVQASLAYLQAPFAELMRLYGSSVEIRGLGLQNSLLLLGSALLLGVAGGWLAVGRHLRDIEPR